MPFRHLLSCKGAEVECSVLRLGNAAANVEINLDGQPFWIRRNLFEALKAFSGLKARDCNYEAPIWIDAICINQGDDVEKAAQIPLMRTIYMQAEVVNVWLGTLEGLPALAVDVLSMLCLESVTEQQEQSAMRGLNPKVEQQRWSVLKETHGVTRENISALAELTSTGIECTRRQLNKEPADGDAVAAALQSPHLFPAGHPFWASWSSLHLNEWFRRVWTVQEVQLAQRPILLTSTYALDWSVLQLCKETWHSRVDIGRRALSMDTYNQLSDKGIQFEAIANYIFSVSPDLLTVDKMTHGGWYLGRALAYTRYHQCSVSKDHVFGILGLVNNSIRSRIIIDYALADAEIYTTAVVEAVDEEPSSLGDLWYSFQHMPQIVQRLPSWVPDFNAIGTWNANRPRGLLTSTVSIRYKNEALVECFQTAFGLPSQHQLSFRGLRLDAVLRCTSRTCQNEELKLHDLREDKYELECFLEPIFRQVTRDWIYEVAAIYGWSSDSKGWNASTVQEIEDRSRACTWSQFYEAGQKAHITEAARLPQICRLFETHNICSTEDARTVLKLDDTVLSEIAVMMIEFMSLHHSRFIFETKSGRLGFSLQPLQEGDQILLVPRGLSLFAVSANGDRYKGTAYVDGLMGDSLLTLPKGLENAWEMFTLTS